MKRLNLPLLALTLLYVWDIIATILVTGGNSTLEGNPVMAWTLAIGGINGFIAAKLIVLALCIPILYIGMKLRQWATYMVYGVLLVYGLTGLAHIIFLIGYSI